MSTLPTDVLELTILLFKNMRDRAFEDGQLSGVVDPAIDFEGVRDSLQSENLLIHGNPNSRMMECHVPPGFFASLESLLESPARRIAPPAGFYLADMDYLHKGHESTAPPAVLHYLQAARLYASLGKVADHQGGLGAARTLVFLHKSKIEITPEYSLSDLHTLVDLQSFEVDFAASDTHQEQKRTILKTVLLELFAGRNKLPFSEILNKFSDFMEKLRASYQLYVAEFSFQKVKEEAEAARIAAAKQAAELAELRRAKEAADEQRRVELAAAKAEQDRINEEALKAADKERVKQLEKLQAMREELEALQKAERERAEKARAEQDRIAAEKLRAEQEEEDKARDEKAEKLKAIAIADFRAADDEQLARDSRINQIIELLEDMNCEELDRALAAVKEISEAV